MTIDTAPLIARLRQAVGEGRLSASAADNIRTWLVDARYAEYAPQVAEHVRSGKWQALDDAFWVILPFGTGGRRGKMYPIGCNSINDRTIGESAQGLASYVREQSPPGAALSCGIAYDTRHRSRHFAERVAEIMAAAGFTVYFLDGHRSTPELSFLVRHKHCSCGAMISASHNPPADNAVKAYWSTGGQLLPPHDQGVIDHVMKATVVERMPFEQARAAGKIIFCQEEVDREYQAAVLAQGHGGPRNVRILYSPMHGVGATSIVPVLEQAGFRDVEIFEPQREPDGDFPNVPSHIANPENPDTYDAIITWGQEGAFDLILTTDPDADRLGCAAPVSKGGAWRMFTGNQLAALLTDYLLETRQAEGKLAKQDYVIKTMVTSEMVRRIADSYGVATHGDLHVGFKYIGGEIDERGAEHFVLGVEESHGYLVGDHCRDKDAAVAALLVAELAARAKQAGQTLHEKLDALFWQHGCHVETTYSKTMPGSEGMTRMRQLMQGLRQSPPTTLGGLRVVRMRDYLSGQEMTPGGETKPMAGPPGDMVVLDLEAEGNFVAIRPSGTEPKAKFYLFAYQPPELLANLDDAKQELATRLRTIGQELFALTAAR